MSGAEGGCGHTHENALAAFVCDTASAIYKNTGRACVVAVDDTVGDLSDPAVSVRGNVTSVASMVRGVLDMLADMPRPETCEVCQRNFDLLIAARLALAGPQGSC